MQVKDIMAIPVTIDKSDRIAHALDLMDKHNIRRLLVTSNGKLGGIITMRQIARVLGARQKLGLPASSLHVVSATLDAVIKVPPEMGIEDATPLLQKTSVLVVMEDDKILGWVRPREILAVIKATGVAADVMHVPLKVSPKERLIHARRMMLDRDVGRLPVVEGGRLTGILSERDVAKALRAFRDLVPSNQQESRIRNLLIMDAMNHDVKSVHTNTPLEDVWDLILTENRGGVPVLNDSDDLVGMVTRRCLLDYLVGT
ncbi:MAG: CBS domain-containing protein [Methanotrichaceae archaeon]